MIPPWTNSGLLPPGVHRAEWIEVVDRFGWNSRRLSLLLGVRAALDALSLTGCTEVWLDGSFISNTELPSDWDGCWAYQGIDVSRLDPVLLDFSPTGRTAIKSKYLGDLLYAGIESVSGLPFVDFFQQSRDGKPKGIVLLNPQETR